MNPLPVFKKRGSFSRQRIVSLALPIFTLLIGCSAQDLAMPPLPNDGVCCQLNDPVPQGYLRRRATTFEQCRRICATEKKPFSLFAGFDLSAGGRHLFGCGIQELADCAVQPLSACTQACLRDNTCIIRFDTVPKVLERRTEQRSRQREDTAQIQTTKTDRRGDVVSQDDKTIRVNETEKTESNVTTGVDERTNTTEKKLHINTSGLKPLGGALRAGILAPGGQLGVPGSNSLSPQLTVTLSHPGAATTVDRGRCCSSAENRHVPRALPGVASLDAALKVCEHRLLPVIVRLSEQGWGCANQQLDIACKSVLTCENCVQDRACLILYKVAVISVVRATRRTAVVTDSNLSINDSSRTLLTTEQGIEGGRAARETLLGNRTRQDQRGTETVTSTSLKTVRTSIAPGVTSPGSLGPAGRSTQITASQVGARHLRTNGSLTTGSKDKIQLEQDIRVTGGQLSTGIRESTDTRQQATKQSTVDTAFRTATQNNSLQGTATGEDMPLGLTPGRNGNISLTSTESEATTKAREVTVDAELRRLDTKSTLRADDGSTRHRNRIEASLSTMGTRTLGRNDTEGTNTTLITDDKGLGSTATAHSSTVTEGTRESDILKETVQQTSDRDVATCKEGCVTDVSRGSEKSKVSQAKERLEFVAKQTEVDSSVSAGAHLPTIHTSAATEQQASIGSRSADELASSSNVTTVRRQAPGAQSSRKRVVVEEGKRKNQNLTEEVTTTHRIHAEVVRDG